MISASTQLRQASGFDTDEIANTTISADGAWQPRGFPR